MIKTNVSEILKPIAEKAKTLTKVSQFDIQLLEISAMKELEMDCLHGTDGKLFIKIYPDKTIEIRHHTNDGTYYYYPLNPDHTDPRQCKPKGRSYMFDPKKTYRKGWKKKQEETMSTFAVKLLLKERRALLNNMQLRGPGKGLFDSRPHLVGELDESIQILKKANGKKKR